MPRIRGNNRISAFFLVFSLLFAFVFTVKAEINDDHFSKQWYLQKLNAENFLSYPLRGDGPIVAVIDSGVHIDHPDLRNNIWINTQEIAGNGVDDDYNGFIDDIYGWNFIENNANPRPVINDNANEDGLNHGTMISGIISAEKNNIGIVGLSPNSRIMALRALNERGEGRINDVVRAIDYAVFNGADIINLSFSGLAYDESFNSAVERASKAGVIIIAAAGNQSFDLNTEKSYPACFSDFVIGVSSVDALNQKTDFSSYGSDCINISAPGISFFSTYFYDDKLEEIVEYSGYWSGTSMSTALVSGALARIKHTNPKLSNDGLLEVLLRSSSNVDLLNPGYQGQLGDGVVDVLNSVKWADEKWLNLKSSLAVYSHQEAEDSTLYLKDSKANDVASLELGTVSKNPFSLVSDNSNKSIIIGAGVGELPYVSVLDLDGNMLNQFLAYHESFKGGVDVAIGDITGDGENEIITGAGPGGGPHVRIFKADGTLIGQFFAYSEMFKGGVNVSIGDITGDGRKEIVTGAGPGGGPHVRIFNDRAQLLGQFFAYEEDFRGGIQVKIADVFGSESKARKEIVVAPGPGRLPEVKIFDNFGKQRRLIMAYSSKFQSGVNLYLGDVDKDGLDDIIVGAGPGGAPHLRAFNGKGVLISSFYALDELFTGGIKVSLVEHD